MSGIEKRGPVLEAGPGTAVTAMFEHGNQSGLGLDANLSLAKEIYDFAKKSATLKVFVEHRSDDKETYTPVPFKEALKRVWSSPPQPKKSAVKKKGKKKKVAPAATTSR